MACSKGLIIMILFSFYMFTAIRGKQYCVTHDGEVFAKNTKIYTSDCLQECTCKGEDEYSCEALCPMEHVNCKMGEMPKLKKITKTKRGRSCKCEVWDGKCVKM